MKDKRNNKVILFLRPDLNDSIKVLSVRSKFPCQRDKCRSTTLGLVFNLQSEINIVPVNKVPFLFPLSSIHVSVPYNHEPSTVSKTILLRYKKFHHTPVDSPRCTPHSL